MMASPEDHRVQRGNRSGARHACLHEARLRIKKI